MLSGIGLEAHLGPMTAMLSVPPYQCLCLARHGYRLMPDFYVQQLVRMSDTRVLCLAHKSET